MEIAEIHSLFLKSSGISTDTRKIVENGMFFALSGANFNGNDFVEQALSQGAAYAVTDEPKNSKYSNVIIVDDVLGTLQKLANYHRLQFDIPVIGITGSNGKTTSKELIGAVLSAKYNVLITQGNLNNHIGVPLTVLQLTSNHEMAIVEMGASKPGDIKELVEIAEPNFGIITNIGAAHIEGFGSLEGVKNTKKEMYDFISEREGHIFYHADDETLVKILPENVSLSGYGKENGAVKGELTGQNPFIQFKWSYNNYTSPNIDTNLVGHYNFTNFLLAATVGNFFDVEKEEINKSLESYQPSNNRSQVMKTDKNTLIVDCYNANPTSVKAALVSFSQMVSDYKKVAILGDMLELGELSEEAHQEINNYCEDLEIETLLIGEEMKKVSTNFPQFSNWEDALNSGKIEKLSDQLILLKGSRGIRLEKLIDHL